MGLGETAGTPIVGAAATGAGAGAGAGEKARQEEEKKKKDEEEKQRLEQRAEELDRKCVVSITVVAVYCLLFIRVCVCVAHTTR